MKLFSNRKRGTEHSLGDQEVSQLSLSQHLHIDHGSQATDNHFQSQQSPNYRCISSNSEMGNFFDELPAHHPVSIHYQTWKRRCPLKTTYGSPRGREHHKHHCSTPCKHTSLKRCISQLKILQPKPVRTLHYNEWFSMSRPAGPGSVQTQRFSHIQCGNEFSVESDCLMKGVNIVIPSNLQEQMLKLLHEAHPGMI